MRKTVSGIANWTHGEALVIKANKHLGGLLRDGKVDDARKVFDEMPKRDEFTWNTMLTGYANAGRIVEAEKLFEEIPKRSSVTWSALVSGYCNAGCEDESFRLFYEMQHEGHRPSQFTLGSLLRLCSIKGFLSRGEQIHGYAVKSRFDKDVFVVTALIDVYAKCLCVMEAEYLFKGMPEGRNHVTWTAMINGYSLNGDAVKTIHCFAAMRSEAVEANQYTFPGVLASCGSLLDLEFGSQVHSCVIHGGFSANLFVQSALVDMYSRCGDLTSAWKVVESMKVDDSISWNALIHGCVSHGLVQQALILFKTMHAKGMKLDEFTYPSAINSLSSMKDVGNSYCIHSLVVKSGFEDNTLVSNALIDMYAKQSNLNCASKLFELMVEKDVVSWTSLITGCAHSGCHDQALKLFCRMRSSGTKPDSVVISSSLSSCAELTLLELGQQLHANSIKSGIEEALSVNNSLISLYAHCGCLEQATRVFNSMESKSVISWTALIMGYAQNGEGMKAVELHERMIASGVRPDSITFIGLLFACSHGGLTELGRRYFDSMVKEYRITPVSDHYACMIDLLGRSGKLHEAEELLNRMTAEPDAAVWKSLLSACRLHGNMDLARKAAAKVFELEPHDPVPYVILANMYASAGKWQEAASIRKLMKSKGIGKEPGHSWMEIKGEVHTFTSEDRTHPESRLIFSKVDEVLMRIKGVGYVPDVKFALHDIDEDWKTQGLAYHGEKLAVAYGLLKLPEGAPIHIYKNIRVCGDCHSAMKFISSVYNRHIVLRDSNRFHHFRGGDCSCADYW